MLICAANPIKVLIENSSFQARSTNVSCTHSRPRNECSGMAPGWPGRLDSRRCPDPQSASRTTATTKLEQNTIKFGILRFEHSELSRQRAWKSNDTSREQAYTGGCLALPAKIQRNGLQAKVAAMMAASCAAKAHLKRTVGIGIRTAQGDVVDCIQHQRNPQSHELRFYVPRASRGCKVAPRSERRARSVPLPHRCLNASR